MSRKLHESIELYTSDGLIKVIVMDWVNWQGSNTAVLLGIDAPANVIIKRDNMKKEKS